MKRVKYAFWFILIMNVNCSRGQSPEKISSGGISQIGMSLSPNQKYFAYIDIGLDSAGKRFQENTNIIRVANPTIVIQHIPKVKFLDFYKDSVVLILDAANNLSAYSVSSKRLLKKYDLILEPNDYTEYAYKVIDDNFFYKKDSQIIRYNLTSGEKNNVKLKIDYNGGGLARFDVFGQKCVICVKSISLEEADIAHYDFYLCDLNSGEAKKIYSNVSGERTYDPFISYVNANEIVFSEYKDGKAYLNYYDVLKSQVVKTENYNDYKIISFSISDAGEKLITLFDEKIRSSGKATGIEALVSGCSVYIVK